MKKCEKCNKTIFSGKLCKNCLWLAEQNILSSPSTQKIYMDQFNQENMLISYYANIMHGYILSLEFMYKDLEYLPKYKNQIEPSNFEEAKKMMHINFKNKIEEIKKEKIKMFSKTGEVKYFTALVGLEEDIKDTIKLFPEFEKDLNYDDLEQIINRS